MQDRIEIAHQYERDVDLILNGFQLSEEFGEGHAVLESLRGSTLDDGAIGEWVAEGNTYFDHGNATTLHCEDNIGSAIECGTAGTEVKRKELFVFAVVEKGIDLIHIPNSLINSFNLLTSLSPGAISKRELRSMPIHLGCWKAFKCSAS